MRGHELRQRLTQLMREHRVTPIVRPPLPLLAPVECSQIMEGIAASVDVDAERTSFAAGSLSWSCNPCATALPDRCLHLAEADVRSPRRKSGFDPEPVIQNAALDRLSPLVDHASGGLRTL